MCRCRRLRLHHLDRLRRCHAGQCRPDRIPAGTHAAMAAFQVLCPVFAATAVFYVVRKSLRERQLCVEAAIVIGSTVAWWHDPLINWFQPTLFYNAGLVNFGNWTENIPGWLSPDGRLMAEPVLMIGMIYIWMPLTMGMIARWAMGRARLSGWRWARCVRSYAAGSRCTSSSSRWRSLRCTTDWSVIPRRSRVSRCGPGRRFRSRCTVRSFGRWC
ncbi:hypothetical protein I552_2230 [Mycobacterium xenopi 3993]|nr:hypothetical protein I552_2230 [Mycobacterium xenopi 3993]